MFEQVMIDSSLKPKFLFGECLLLFAKVVVHEVFNPQGP
jgi:hypothetical protein